MYRFFTISGWIVMMVVILQLSDFLASWLFFMITTFL